MVDEERVLVMNLRELFDAAGAATVRPQMYRPAYCKRCHIIANS